MLTETGASIEVRDLWKRFGPREVLRGVDLDIAPGQFVAIVGKSGCGKSTLLRLLAELEAPSGGAIRIADEAPRIGAPLVRMMFQEARLLPWKRALANVALGLPAERRTDAAAALAKVGLADRALDWPAALSGGQRQRISLARALVSRPRLLLLDEPLGALDALTRIEMQRLIERVWQDHGFTGVLVTHDVAEAVALADRIVVLGEGRITLDRVVDLPRPRARGSHAFAAIEADVLDQILAQRPEAPVVTLPAPRPLERTA